MLEDAARLLVVGHVDAPGAELVIGLHVVPTAPVPEHLQASREAQVVETGGHLAVGRVDALRLGAHHLCLFLVVQAGRLGHGERDDPGEEVGPGDETGMV